MQERFERTPETTLQKVLRYFALAMTLVYPAFGIYLLLSSPGQIAIQPQVKIILGIMLILYGIYRFYRTYQRYTKGDQSAGRND